MDHDGSSMDLWNESSLETSTPRDSSRLERWVGKKIHSGRPSSLPSIGVSLLGTHMEVARLIGRPSSECKTGGVPLPCEFGVASNPSPHLVWNWLQMRLEMGPSPPVTSGGPTPRCQDACARGAEAAALGRRGEVPRRQPGRGGVAAEPAAATSRRSRRRRRKGGQRTRTLH